MKWIFPNLLHSSLLGILVLIMLISRNHLDKYLKLFSGTALNFAFNITYTLTFTAQKIIGFLIISGE